MREELGKKYESQMGFELTTLDNVEPIGIHNVENCKYDVLKF